QNHRIGHGIIGQHAHRLSSFENFAEDLVAPTPRKDLMPEAIADDLEDALVTDGFFKNLDVLCHGRTLVAFAGRRTNVLALSLSDPQIAHWLPHLHNSRRSLPLFDDKFGCSNPTQSVV